MEPPTKRPKDDSGGRSWLLGALDVSPLAVYATAALSAGKPKAGVRAFVRGQVGGLAAMDVMILAQTSGKTVSRKTEIEAWLDGRREGGDCPGCSVPCSGGPGQCKHHEWSCPVPYTGNHEHCRCDGDPCGDCTCTVCGKHKVQDGPDFICPSCELGLADHGVLYEGDGDIFDGIGEGSDPYASD